MIKVIGIIITALILTTMLKKVSPVFSLFVTLCSAIILLLMISEDLSNILTIFSSVAKNIDEDNIYFGVLLKILGISLLSQFIVNMCRDCGESALASQAEFASKIIIVITVLPIFETIIKIATGLLK